MSQVIGLGPRAQLALDTLQQKPVRGIPSWMLNIMGHAALEQFAGVARGEYRRNPNDVYLRAQHRLGTCMIDQWIPRNPLSMGDAGFDEPAVKGVTQGADQVVRDGMAIESPEDVVAHMEQFVFPDLRQRIAALDAEAIIGKTLAYERDIQALFGPDMLKAPYGIAAFPKLDYGRYGYELYFTTYAVYPEMIERHFALQADLAVQCNKAIAEAWRRGNWPRVLRLDHDMADSRGLLVSMASLERLWMGHFQRSIQPLLDASIPLLWHCDGNLMALLPRLLELGFAGFQGFQYEDGMDYPAICRWKCRDGRDPIIIAGVSVTTTLPRGSPDDVRKQLRWLVEHGPRTGLFLAASSSITPGVPWGNLQALAEGLAYYREHGRQ